MKYLLACACLSLPLLTAAHEGSHHQCSFHGKEASIRVPGHIIDITKELSPATLHWDSPTGLGEFRDRYTRIEDGDLANQSHLRDFPVHVATHVDAPSHFSQEHFESGIGVEALDLYVLNGGVLLIEVPFETNITAAALESLGIPSGVERIIFKTLNTKRGLMHRTEFITNYTSLTEDGAQWILENTAIRLVGIDYTSVAAYEDLRGPHVVLLPNDVIALEGLVLDEVAAGFYTLHCLPLKLSGSDGAPTRCILIT